MILIGRNVSVKITKISENVYSFSNFSPKTGYYRLQENVSLIFLTDTVSVAENNQFILSIAGITNQATAYERLTGLDDTEFAFAGGKLIFNNKKDYEVDKKTYKVKLRIIKSDGGVVTATDQILTIKLTDIDEIESKLKETSFSISENATIIQNLDDILSKDNLDEISYKILSEFNGDLFQTDSAGINLKFKDSKNYETDNKNYTLVVELQGTDSKIQTLRISLTDIDEIESKLKITSFSLVENTTSIQNLANILSKDNLDDISYKILSYLDGNLFQTNIDGTSLEFKESKDYETDKRNYILAIELQGTDRKIQTLKISLTNIGDTDSKLKTTSFFVSENTDIIQNLDNVLTKDYTDEISYKILSYLDGSLFQTNIDGNILKFKNSKDYETDSKNYTLVIELQGTDRKIQTLRISLTDINENKRSFSSSTSSLLEDSSFRELKRYKQVEEKKTLSLKRGVLDFSLKQVKSLNVNDIMRLSSSPESTNWENRNLKSIIFPNKPRLSYSFEIEKSPIGTSSIIDISSFLFTISVNKVEYKKFLNKLDLIKVDFKHTKMLLMARGKLRNLLYEKSPIIKLLKGSKRERMEKLKSTLKLKSDK